MEIYYSPLTRLKLEILEYGVTFEPYTLFSSFKNIHSYKIKKIKTTPISDGREVYDKSNDNNVLPSELFIEDGYNKSIVKLRYNHNSPLRLTLNDTHLNIYRNGEAVELLISLVPTINTLQMLTPFKINGKNTFIGDFIDVVGADRISIILFEGCYNWICGKACKFCDLHPKRISDKVIKPTLNNLKEFDFNVSHWWNSNKDFYFEGIKYSLNMLLTHETLSHKHLFFMAGNLMNNSQVWDVAEDLISYLSSYINLNEFDNYLNIAPHDSIDKLVKIKEIGIAQVQYNLEIADKVLFEEMCPGKMIYEDFINKLREAVFVFGKGRVRSNFVLGLQDISQMLEEIERLAEFGIVADYSIFQPKRNTPLQNKLSPSFDEVIRFTEALSAIYIKYGFNPIFCSQSSRSSLINEIYYDTKRNIQEQY